jgi:hypothetical protein
MPSERAACSLAFLPCASAHFAPALATCRAAPPRFLLFLAEGAITVQKDVRLPEHHILKVPNVHVVMTLLSLKSRGYVRETFNWCVGTRQRAPAAGQSMRIRHCHAARAPTVRLHTPARPGL